MEKENPIILSRVIKHLASNKKPIIRNVMGKKLVLLPRVFDPIFPDSQLLARSIKNLNFKFNNVLDLGTGCGIQAIFISQHAKNITITDINLFALENAKLNIELHRLGNKVQIIKSDLFSNITEKYDLIIFNPPFFSKRPRNIIEKAVTDYKNSLLYRFFKNVKNYLNNDGKIIMVISDVIDIDLIKQLVINSGFNFEILDKKKYDSSKYFVYLIH